MIYLKLAWKNIWRNKRRTVITWASIFFAVILSSLMMSVKEGVYDNMIASSAGDYSGYAQIHAADYFEEKTIDYCFEPSEELISQIEGNELVRDYIPRIESFALAASEELTKGSLVVGIDPEKEARINGFDSRVYEGEFLSEDSKGVLVGEGLAKYLKLGLGDTIVLLSQGYQGVTAAGKYHIQGLVRFGSPELSKQVIFLPLREAQLLYGAYGMVNNLILDVEDGESGVEAAAALRSVLSEEYEVMDWIELNPELVNMMETDRVEGYVFMFIMYLVIGFGIFGTMLMMIAERRHEFGVLVAIGMRRYKLAFLVWMEVVLISIVGAFLGIFGALPISIYYNLNPIDLGGGEMAQMYEDYGLEAVLQFSVDPMVFLNQAIVIAIMSSLIALYPFGRILRINSIEEMRS